MNNFPFEHNGEELWYSRSLACNLVIIVSDRLGHKPRVLACERGQGCAFNKGLWNVPGGFIDFNENAKTCAIRETWEETGLPVDEQDVHFLYLDTEPRSYRQTMVASHYAFFFEDDVKNWMVSFSNEHCEPGEVEEIRWIPLDEIDEYRWTNHQEDNIRAAWERIKLDGVFNIL